MSFFGGGRRKGMDRDMGWVKKFPFIGDVLIGCSLCEKDGKSPPGGKMNRIKTQTEPRTSRSSLFCNRRQIQQNSPESLSSPFLQVDCVQCIREECRQLNQLHVSSVKHKLTHFSTRHMHHFVGRGGSLVDSSPFVKRVTGSL